MEMAITFSHHNSLTYFSSKSFSSDLLRPLIVAPFHPHRPFLPVRLRSVSNARQPRRLSAGLGPPSSPDPDPPRPPGFAGKLSRFQDRVQIFLAVLFWMSLFFWASVWDRNNSGGPNKGSRFRR